MVKELYGQFIYSNAKSLTMQWIFKLLPYKVTLLPVSCKEGVESAQITSELSGYSFEKAKY